MSSEKTLRCASRRYRFNAFFASPFKAPQSLRDSSPRGSERLPAAPRFRRKRRCKCRFPLRPHLWKWGSEKPAGFSEPQN